MASILRVNTLTDASSNNSTAMSTVNQGTAKNWSVCPVSSGTPSIDDSFNLASITDADVGNVYVNLTNAMSSVNYSNLVSRQVVASAGTGSNFVQSVTTANRSTSSYRINNFENGSDADPNHYDTQVNGDLA